MKFNAKTKVASFSILSNVILIALKIMAGILSGSVSIVSEAIHSSIDLIASFIAFISVSLSSKPADKEHPYGHGKIENISGLIEGLLIFWAAYLIIKEAIHKIVHPAGISETTIAIAVMLFSALANWVVAMMLFKVAKAEDSIALEADALHHKTDVYTSLGVAGGLLLIRVTGINILDPIVAMLVATLIIKESWELCVSAFQPLVDGKLPDEDENKIAEVMKKYEDEIVDYHRLRTRKSGHMRYIEFHLKVFGDMTVIEAHALADQIEKDLEDELKNTNVTIHIEPGKIQTDLDESDEIEKKNEKAKDKKLNIHYEPAAVQN